MNKDLDQWNKLVKRQDEVYHRCARKSGLADAQFWVLYALCETEQTFCQNLFCENWCYSKQTVSAAVANLERAGFLYLTFAKGSRKQKELHLTAKGETFCDQYVRTLQTAEERALERLSNEERESFFRTLSILLEGLEKEML